MDWQIRIALLIFGVLLIAYIYYDYAKKKNIQKENEKLKKQFQNISTGVDSAGFDSDGVGEARTKQKPENEVGLDNKIEPNFGELEIKNPNSKKTKQKLDKKTEHAKVNDKNEESKNLDERIYSLIIRANDGALFKGKDFMPLFLSQGLKFGEMNIFHRYKNVGKNPGNPIYSIANAVEPGTFNLTNIDSFSTPAFAIFTSFSGEPEFVNDYINLVKTAEFFVNELGGELLDESKQVYSKEKHQVRLQEIKNHLNQT